MRKKIFILFCLLLLIGYCSLKTCNGFAESSDKLSETESSWVLDNPVIIQKNDAILPDLIQKKSPNVSTDKHLFTIINQTADKGIREPSRLIVAYTGITDKGVVNGTYIVEINDCVQRVFDSGLYSFSVSGPLLGYGAYKNKNPYKFKGGNKSDIGLGTYRFKIDSLTNDTIWEDLKNQLSDFELKQKYIKCYED